MPRFPPYLSSSLCLPVSPISLPPSLPHSFSTFPLPSHDSILILSIFGCSFFPSLVSYHLSLPLSSLPALLSTPASRISESKQTLYFALPQPPGHPSAGSGVRLERVWRASLESQRGESLESEVGVTLELETVGERGHLTLALC
ncbi:hypothetical protein E2C01_059521 [Portunus trituberculatus]|uniref:Uncharacterized protein n=1 Tax=Portunus trituberculatus TaxID=210409 RepID=A0A5B7H800_PORTR|nr:hypothetical protein [Portunus trituberculatus]